jgi:hypothetical protein
MNEAGFFYHSFQGPFDEACCVLWELDVARADPGDGSCGLPWAGNQNVQAAAFAFFSDTETRARIVEQIPLRQELVDRALVVFVRIACDYGDVGSTLSIGCEPFIPQAEYARQIDGLTISGYIERCGELVKWTQKIADTMKPGDSGMSQKPRLCLA